MSTYDGKSTRQRSPPHGASCNIQTCIVSLPDHSKSGDCAAVIESGDSCTPTCNEGYTLDGIVACDDKGLVSTARCIPKSCQPSLVRLEHGTLGACGRALQHGEDCTPECDDGYDLINNAKCNLGLLRKPKCMPKSCSVDAPVNGTNGDCPAVLKHGDACQPDCNDGHELTDVTRCQFGKLLRPRCVPQSCAVTPPTHGDTGLCPKILKDGESCKPDCNEGYDLVGDTMCNSGKLSISNCKPSDCDVTKFLQDEHIGNCPDTLQDGESCQPECSDHGQEPIGLGTCDHGKFRMPSCKPKSCNQVEIPFNATHGDCGATLEDGQSCRPICQPGHSLSSDVRCDKGTLYLAECKPSVCEVERPKNGNVGNCPCELEHGESCTPECDVGYEPGNGMRCSQDSMQDSPQDPIQTPIKCQHGKLDDYQCVPKSCPTPVPPMNGSVGECTTDLTNGETCWPSCNDGYEPIEPTSCHLGVLSVGMCLPKSCRVPPPQNGSAGNCPSLLQHSQTCQVECMRGYRPSGDTACSFGKVKLSECVPKSCMIDNKRDFPSSKSGNCPSELDHGKSCTQICPLGHTLAADTTCSFGKLTVGKCIPDHCEQIRDIQNGSIGSCLHPLQHGERCLPTCDEGYTLSQPTSCTAGQLKASVCIPNDCEVDSKTMTSANATAGDCPPILEHGETCTPQCNVGHTIDSRASGSASCTAGKLAFSKCTPSSCQIIAPEHGNVGNCPAVMEDGRSCSFNCNSGFKVTGPALTTCSEGVLKAQSCEPISCPNVTPPLHGRWGTCQANKPLLHGESCTPECNDGYSLSKPYECVDGTLSVSTCIPKLCKHIAAPKNGTIGDCSNELKTGDTCTPTCNDGYALSGPIVCSLGNFTAPICIPNECKVVAPKNGTIGNCTSTLADGERCEPKCNDGYFPSSLGAYCNVGVFTSPTCIPKSCAMIIPEKGGMGDCPNELSDLQSCTPSCQRGYTLSGQTSCQKGTLGRSVCVPRSCSNFKPPVHGNVGSCTSTLEHGDECVPECEQGYTLSRPTKCNVGDLTESSCLPNSCAIVVPENATIGTCGPTIRSGEVCLPQCNAGFFLKAPTTCNAGRLSPSICMPESCRVTIPDHGQIGDCSETIESDSKCHPTCDDGYILRNPTTCIDGKLTTSVCGPLSCSVPIPLNGDKGDCPQSLDHGNKCTPTCHDGYSLSNNTTCEKGVVKVSTCVPDACVVKIPKNGLPGDCPTMLRDGETCQPACLFGYEPHGEIQCEKGRIRDPISECRPSSCQNQNAQPNGTKGPNWKDTLQLGESSRFVCAMGYTETKDEKCTSDDNGVPSMQKECLPELCLSP
jgi:hypothetical protein